MADRIRVEVRGDRQILAAFSKLSGDAQDELRDRSRELAETLAGKIRAAASADSPQSALMARTVKAQRDRLPVVTAGGTTRVGRNRKPAFKILYGSEFGSHRYKQFRPHRGANSYWFFKTYQAELPAIQREWREMADALVRRWSA